MNIGIVGTGYVGIVTGSCLAEFGHKVICYDIDKAKIGLYGSGRSAIYEPGLAELLQKNTRDKRLSFTSDISAMVGGSDIIFICVGTPPLPDGSADLSQVETAVRDIAENAPEGSYKVLVEKSTVPVGTHKRLKNITKLYNKSKSRFDFVVNSEFLKEGDAINDFLHPDRIVIGVETDESKNAMLGLYSGFDTQKIIVDPSSAEIIKYASNSFLAMKISFINMVADLCEKAGADIEKVADGMGFDRRIGRDFLNAGIGYGGSCFPKDVKAFIQVLGDNFVDNSILASVDNFNQARYKKIIATLEEELWILKNKQVAVWGLAFKPETDDVRESPAIKIVRDLAEKQVNLNLYDPQAMANFEKLFPPAGNIVYHKNPLEAIRGAEALIIMTEWKEFGPIRPAEIYKLMKLPVVVDGRNIFSPDEMKRQGFRYFPIGKGDVLNDMKKSK